MRDTNFSPENAYITTASGNRIHPLNPTVDEIRLEDIASHLSKMPRWSGALKGDDVYTVAQHSVFVSRRALEATGDPLIALDGLHHDSSEAFLADVARPIKYVPGFMEIYKYYEKKLTEVIYHAFCIPFFGEHHPAVKTADNRMLATEARDVMPEPVGGYGVYEFDINIAYQDWAIIHVWSHKFARQAFVSTHNELLRMIEQAA